MLISKESNLPPASSCRSYFYLSFEPPTVPPPLAPQSGAEFEVVNVLDEIYNPGLREAIKAYSAWPTIPQVHMLPACCPCCSCSTWQGLRQEEALV